MNMELVTQTDIYIHSIDDHRNYVDKTPSFNNLKNGISCPCGARKGVKFNPCSLLSISLLENDSS